MKKFGAEIRLIVSMLCLLSNVRGIDLSGRVLSSNGSPIEGVTAALYPTSITTYSDGNGWFNIKGPNINLIKGHNPGLRISRPYEAIVIFNTRGSAVWDSRKAGLQSIHPGWQSRLPRLARGVYIAKLYRGNKAFPTRLLSLGNGGPIIPAGKIMDTPMAKSGAADFKLLLAKAGYASYTTGITDLTDTLPDITLPAVSLPGEAEQVALSLGGLSKKLKEAPESRKDSAISRLYGLNWIQGYVIDTLKHDIVLFGKADPNRPPLKLSDLSVLMDNVWNKQGQQTGCSIDPRPADIKKIQQFLSTAEERAKLNPAGMDQVSKEWKSLMGPQDVLVLALPRDSRVASVIVDADYRLKKIATGELKAPGIESYLDIMARRVFEEIASTGSQTSPGQSASRFWFYPDAVPPSYEHTYTALALRNGRVNLLTEQEHITASGNLGQTGKADPGALEFVRNVTNNYEALSAAFPVYADMENIYRLAGLLNAMYRQKAGEHSKLSLDYLTNKHTHESVPVPQTLPGYTYDRIFDTTLIIKGQPFKIPLWIPVSGGVGLDFNLAPEQFVPAATLDLLSAVVLYSRPASSSISWKFNHVPMHIVQIFQLLLDGKSPYEVRDKLEKGTPVRAIQKISDKTWYVLLKTRDSMDLFEVTENSTRLISEKGNGLALFQEKMREICRENSNNEAQLVYFSLEGEWGIVQAGNHQLKLSRDEMEKMFNREPNAAEPEIRDFFLKNFEGKNVIILRDGLACATGKGNRPWREDGITQSSNLFTLLNKLLGKKVKLFVGEDWEKARTNIQRLNWSLNAKDIVTLVDESESGINTKEFIEKITKIFNGSEISVTSDLQQYPHASNIVVITGNNDNKLTAFLNSLAGAGSLKNKTILLNTCKDNTNPNLVNADLASKLVQKYGANGIIRFDEVISKIAVEMMLTMINEILSNTQIKQGHLGDLLMEAIERALEGNPTPRLKLELEKLRNHIFHISQFQKTNFKNLERIIRHV